MAYFSSDRIKDLNAGREEVRAQFSDLRERFFLRTYKTEKGAEHAKHGFCRRLGTLRYAIEDVYDILPPDFDAIPEYDDVIDATMAIQAFTFNAFGCLENLAWILAHEKDMRKKNGQPLPPKRIGLGKPDFLRNVSKQFASYLETRKAWFDHLVGFRDALAHRIPLYVPPYVVPGNNKEKYDQLEAKKWQEPARSNPEEYEKVKAEQLMLCQFVPAMTHSIYDSATHVEFHSQLLIDYATIDEHGREVLEELDR